MLLPNSLLQDYLANSSRLYPDKVAIICGGNRWTYLQLESKSNAIANALRENFVQRGDKIVILAENNLTVVAAFWAVLKADAVACLISPHSSPNKLKFYLENTRATALVSPSDLAPIITQQSADVMHLRTLIIADNAIQPVCNGKAERKIRLDELATTAPVQLNLNIDLAAIIFTSGSTGMPKGVMLTHRNMRAACDSVNLYLGNHQDDVIINALPLCFDYGLYQMIMAIAVGATLVLERSFALLPQVLAHAAIERVTALPAVPAVFALLGRMSSVPPLLALRYITSTGSALASRHITILQEHFPQAEIFSMYGVTECKRCTYLPPRDLATKPDSVGIAIPGIELWLVNEQDQRIGPNETGELVIRGATVMSGYWQNPEATAKRLKPGLLPGEQVLYTGDLCRLDEEGYLYFVARKDDIIKSKGEKVAPREIELVLLDIPGVIEAAVIGVEDDLWGQVASAFVVIDPAVVVEKSMIMAECRSRLEPTHIPKYLKICLDLPHTSSSKIDKTALPALLDPHS